MVESIRQNWGLDRPVLEQYATWFGNLAAVIWASRVPSTGRSARSSASGWAGPCWPPARRWC
ncbi:hypothetical protein ACFQX6_08160 [Streptosporangium lutulentum]